MFTVFGIVPPAGPPRPRRAPREGRGRRDRRGARGRRLAGVREVGSASEGGRHSTICFLILSENSACQVPICAVAA